MADQMAASSTTHYIQMFEEAGYGTIARTLELIMQEFPELADQFPVDRINGWLQDLAGTGSRPRDENQLRDDIFKHVVTADRLIEKYGIDQATAEAIIKGGNDGGINYGDFLATGGAPAGGGVGTAPTDVDADAGGGSEGVGDPGTEDVPGMTIMTSRNMEWFYDKDLGKWYVSYQLPGSGKRGLFEATPDQMDLLFGEGMRPTGFKEIELQSFLQDPNHLFIDSITDVEGTGEFEDRYHRMVAIALDGGVLPEWAAKDGAAMDIIFVAESEDKPLSWVIDKLSDTDAFKARFPGIAKIQETANSTMEDAITGWLEFEAGTRQALTGAGLDPSLASPETIGALLEKGHSITTVDTTVKTFDRMQKFRPALEAFNGILGAQGLDQITTLQDMFDFVAGSAPTDLYDVWEASTLSEQATAAGLGDFFSADDAIRVALQTAGSLDSESVTAAMQKSAEFALRLRHEINLGKYDLDVEDLIDLNLNQPLRSGRDAAVVGQNIQRVMASAQKERAKRLQPFQGFTAQGTPQTRSLSGLRSS